ncbi:MAG: helicase-related protein [Phascolarctobacterium sp.]|nr:helicase-related protein [Phascolarctobacterium sp.]
MKIIDNVNEKLIDDLSCEIKKGSRLSIAAAYFSIYAYEALKKELSNIDELRFIFTDPTFIQNEDSKKEKREFFIPKLSRERGIYGTEFEVKLRNELNQKAIAKECASWLRQKATIKSNVGNKNIQRFMLVDETSYINFNGFTTVDLGCEQGNDAFVSIIKMESPMSQSFVENFNMLWNNSDELQNVTDTVINSISSAYNENAPEFIYFVTLYNIFNEFLEDISEDELPNERTGFKNSKIWSMLFNFQRDAALGIINKLEKYNGCILADSVGLGKTFTALAVMKYYENRNKSVLVLCPKKLCDNWNTYKGNYVNNPIASDRLNYDVLFHSDLSRKRGMSNGIDLGRVNWGNYDLVVIDESHNFRNGGQFDEEGYENRYATLMNKIIRAGVKTKVLMLSATPVNNRFNDLKNQLQLAYEGDTSLIDDKLTTTNSIDDIFRQAQKAYNAWTKLEPEERTVQRLLENLSYDFFTLLDSVTIARSRKHISKYYDTKDIGEFPERLKPISQRPQLTTSEGDVNYAQVFEKLTDLELTIYTPSHFILPSRMEYYAALYGDNKINKGVTQAGREEGIRRLMAINILKRMESSVYSFSLTVKRVKASIDTMLDTIDKYQKHQLMVVDVTEEEPLAQLDLDIDDENYVVGRKISIQLKDMDYIKWGQSLQRDSKRLAELLAMVGTITPEKDNKLQTLLGNIVEKIAHPINPSNKKILIFTAFADTALYLYTHVSAFVKEKYGLNTAMITGTVDGRSTIKNLHCDLNSVLTCFSPVSKDKQLLMPFDHNEIDVLIATDCISEGQNLQDCDYLINYDIHWNPVRIIQRFGRIDRIGSHNKVIQLVNFWPDIDLDAYISLKGRVESRMKIVDMTATGDDNLLSSNEKMDLQYRKKQLERLQQEVVDIEDMDTGISIMDLGLNEFRLDLLGYCKEHGSLEKTPFGLHAVVPANAECPPGVIYVLKNCTENINIDKKNLLHPFYMVYIGEDGEIICNHLAPKKLLDKLRFVCRGKDKPLASLCSEFNKETEDGRNMSAYSELLGEAIQSIVEVKEEGDLDSFLSGEEISFFENEIKGLDDFELICFLVVR